MDFAKRIKLDQKGPVVLAERYDRFCTNCSAVIDDAALEKFADKACTKCSQPVEFRNKSDGNWRRCVRCDAFNRCTFKVCYLCGRHNVHYDCEKPKRLEKALQQKFQQLMKVAKKDQQVVLFSPSSSKLSKNIFKSEKKEVVPLSAQSSTPIINERFDRFCTSCASGIENAALEKFIGQSCVRCQKEIEFRATEDDVWSRCVKCDVFVRCTFKYCYLCSRQNFHFNAEKEKQIFQLKFEDFLRQPSAEVVKSETVKDDNNLLMDIQSSIKVESKLDDSIDGEELSKIGMEAVNTERKVTGVQEDAKSSQQASSIVQADLGTASDDEEFVNAALKLEEGKTTETDDLETETVD